MFSRKRKKLESLDKDELLKTVRQLLAEADALSSRIAAVNEIGVAINETLDIPSILHVVAKQAKWLLDFQHLSVCLLEDDVWTLMTLFGDEVDQPATAWEETSNVGRAIRSKQAQLMRDGSNSRFLADFPSQIIIPLKSGNNVLGTINFAAEESEQYTQDDMRIGYMLSLQLASAIQNSRVLKQLKATQDELELRIADLDAYNHMIAHDLKSPLSGILLSAEMIQNTLPEDAPEPPRRYAKGIRTSVKAMNTMIDRLLFLAKLQHSDTPVEAVDMSLAARYALMRFSHLIEEARIEVHIDEAMPSAIGQEQWIQEIFANFISNAIKYMGEDNPNPTIRITAEPVTDEAQDDDDKQRVRYKVQDTGIGIRPEDQAHLFEMFSRVDERSSIEGLGLGLSIVQRIMSRLDGTLGVESTWGEGSTFWFTLPRAEPISDADAVTDDASDNLANDDDDSTQEEAIVIDDDDALATVFRHALETSGFTTHIITDSRNAMEQIRERQPALITLDMQMPHVSGVEILDAIRADETLKDIKVMVITASTQENRYEQVSDKADIVLSKPVTLNQIQTFIKRIMPPPENTSE